MPYLNEVLVANGTTSLGRVVFSKAVLDIITNSSIIGLAVNAGGSGYVVGETFEISGGTAVSGFVARGVVTAESAGVVTGVKYISAGAYSTLPGATGAATTNSSGVGTGLTVDLTTQTAQWTLDSDDYVDDATDFEWICTSVKSANAPTIGMATEVDTGNEAVRLLTASGYDGAAAFSAQPDGSPEDTTYLNVPGTNPELLLSTTERRVNVVARDGNNVQYGGLGLFIPLTNVDASYPFPAICHAQSTQIQPITDTYTADGNGNSNAGVLHPTNYVSVYGAYRYRDNLSTQWLTIAQVASDAGANSMIWPHKQGYQDYAFTFAPQLSGKSTNPMADGTSRNGIFSDNASSGDTGWFEDADGNADGVQGVAPFGTGAQMSYVVAGHIIRSQTGDVSVIGYIDGYSAVHGVGLTAFEEIESYLSASRYVVFPDTNGSDVAQWVAMEIV